ncbi:hypothetical protein [Methylobacterium sp. Leaf93]|nr:hypothetical protein [Methylobacterium sp. Leaf93]
MMDQVMFVMSDSVEAQQNCFLTAPAMAIHLPVIEPKTGIGFGPSQ